MSTDLFSKKAQSVTEYVILLALVAAALVGMQIYMRRGIQAGVKSVADMMGSQKKGAMDFDFRLKWKIKGDSDIIETAQGEKTTTRMQEGQVRYEREETNTQAGELSRSLSTER